MHHISTVRARVPILAVALFLSACSGGGVSSVTPAAGSLASIHRHASSDKIQHIVIIVQENRSFNNLFYGFPGAKTVKVRIRHQRGRRSRFNRSGWKRPGISNTSWPGF